jgi:predicted RNA binding protein YcfA (HicA-like mRNA interferase family)
VKVRELIKQLEDDGWVQVRMRGSHRQFQHPSKSGTVTVSGNPGIDVPKGTLNSVLKQAGLKQ